MSLLKPRRRIRAEEDRTTGKRKREGGTSATLYIPPPWTDSEGLIALYRSSLFPPSPTTSIGCMQKAIPNTSPHTVTPPSESRSGHAGCLLQTALWSCRKQSKKEQSVIMAVLPRPPVSHLSARVVPHSHHSNLSPWHSELESTGEGGW